MKNLILLVFLLQATCGHSPVDTVRVERRPLQKSSLKLTAPQVYEKRSREASNGRVERYDPAPRIEVVDEKAGKYAFKWIGFDGKQKTVEYQRLDAADVVVSADMKRADNGVYTYIYEIRNLPSSPAFVSRFVVQNFTESAEPLKAENLFIGKMSNNIKRFGAGNWIAYSFLTESGIEAGRAVTVNLTASALPGLVECSTGSGNSMLKGAGEHMPYELESAMNGYDEMPRGYTIGPVDELSKLSSPERAKYLLRRLPQMSSQGWMTKSAESAYEKILETDDLKGALGQAATDLKAGHITNEVFIIIRGLNS